MAVAGSGSKTFLAGAKLLAAEVNGYLMKQSIAQFETTAARDAAITSSAGEGMFAYIAAQDRLYYHDGTSWVLMEGWGTGSPEGLVSASVGAIWHRTNGAAGTALYVKEANTNAVGWTAFPSASGSSGLTLIAESTLGADGTFSFTSIAATYRSLLLVVEGYTSAAVVSTTLNVTFNGDTSAIYDSQRVEHTGAASTPAGSGAGSRMIFCRFPGASAGANRVGTAQILIPDYAGTTFHKTAIAVGGSAETAGTSGSATQGSGRWASTAAINRVDVTTNDGNFASGARATLYGLAA